MAHEEPSEPVATGTQPPTPKPLEAAPNKTTPPSKKDHKWDDAYDADCVLVDGTSAGSCRAADQKFMLEQRIAVVKLMQGPQKQPFYGNFRGVHKIGLEHKFTLSSLPALLKPN